jgi:hypothetical protein
LDDLLTAFLPEDFPLPRPDIVDSLTLLNSTNELKDKHAGRAAVFVEKPDLCEGSDAATTIGVHK